MEQKILKYKKIYRIFIVLTLVGFIDTIIIPILLKNFSINLPQDTGLVTLLLGSLLGNAGIALGVWFTVLWPVLGLIAIILNNLVKKLELNESPTEENKKKYKSSKIIVIVCVIILLLILISMFLLYK